MESTYVVLKLRNLRALVRVIREGVAKLEGERLLGERVEELVVDALLDEDTGAGAASLTVVPEDTVRCPVDGEVHVGVVEDNVGALAAELERNVLEVRLGASLLDLAADEGGAGEGDLVDVGVLGDRRADGVAVTDKNVDDTRREASLLDELTKTERGQGGDLRRLVDDSVAGGECRAKLPAGVHDGEVPWDNETANTDSRHEQG